MWYLKAKYGKRSRTTNFWASDLADATRRARLFAKAYAEYSSGVYGPQCWREGSLTLVNDQNEVFVIRRERPSWLRVIGPDDVVTPAGE